MACDTVMPVLDNDNSADAEGAVLPVSGVILTLPSWIAAVTAPSVSSFSDARPGIEYGNEAATWPFTLRLTGTAAVSAVPSPKNCTVPLIGTSLVFTRLSRVLQP